MNIELARRVMFSHIVMEHERFDISFLDIIAVRGTIGEEEAWTIWAEVTHPLNHDVHKLSYNPSTKETLFEVMERSCVSKFSENCRY
jgi:hypothetical protein